MQQLKLVQHLTLLIQMVRAGVKWSGVETLAVALRVLDAHPSETSETLVLT